MWELDPSPEPIYDSDGELLAECSVIVNEHTVIARTCGAKREPNAAFIVEACNAHDALVARVAELEEALQSVLKASESEICGVIQEPIKCITTGRPLMEALQAARAALAKVKP